MLAPSRLGSANGFGAYVQFHGFSERLHVKESITLPCKIMSLYCFVPLHRLGICGNFSIFLFITAEEYRILLQ